MSIKLLIPRVNKCSICGKVFESYSKYASCCCKDCIPELRQILAHRTTDPDYRPDVELCFEILCPVCGKWFINQRESNSACCSEECKVHWRHFTKYYSAIHQNPELVDEIYGILSNRPKAFVENDVTSRRETFWEYAQLKGLSKGTNIPQPTKIKIGKILRYYGYTLEGNPGNGRLRYRESEDLSKRVYYGVKR